MAKMKMSDFIKGAKTIASKRSPEILTGIGIAGMVTTTILAVRATPKALELIEEEKMRRYKESENDHLTKSETIKVAWKPYIPAAVTGITSIACLIGARSVDARRSAALYSAYKLSETALSEYKEKVVETIGEKKAAVVQEKIAKSHVEKNPVSKNEVIVTGNGNVLCYDHHAGRYFESNIERIKAAKNELNARMINEMYVSLNDFYDEIGLSHTKMGDELGWNLDDGMIDILFDSTIADDGRPCIVIEYRVAPRYGYYKMM